MREAIEGFTAGEFPLLIDGQNGRTEQWIESIDPSKNSHIVGRAGRATPRDVQAAWWPRRRGHWPVGGILRPVIARICWIVSRII